MATRISPRLQGDIGEFSAMGWLLGQGAKVFLPLGHSPDVDMIADFGDRLVRVQVKTSTVYQRDRYDVMVYTRGGNQSWSGVAKYFHPSRCDYLFVHVGDGRRWFIPSSAIDGRTYVRLGGPKYARYEVEPDQPLADIADRRISTLPDPRRGSRAVKGDAL